MKSELLTVLEEFLDKCRTETEKVQSDDNDPRVGISPNMENLVEWLKTGNVR